MFDETKEPVDIFGDVDQAPKTAPPPPGAPGTAPAPRAPLPPSAPTPPPTVEPRERVVRRGPSVLIFVLILLILGGLGAGAYWFFVLREPAAPAVNQPPVNQPPVNQPPVNQPPVNQPVVNEPVQPEPEPPATQPVQPAETFTDADGDGLTDAEEQQLGTNPNAPDTDNDGLSDREEVRIYGSNPTNPDTDGDTFLDGQEVRGGYDPNGPGRIFGVPPQT